MIRAMCVPRVLWIGAMCLSLAWPVVAQPRPAQEAQERAPRPEELPPDFFGGMAEGLGAERDQPYFAVVREYLQKSANWTIPGETAPAKGPAEFPEADRKPVPLLAHVRFSEGTELPTTAVAAAERERQQEEATTLAVEQAQAKYGKNWEEKILEMAPGPDDDLSSPDQAEQTEEPPALPDLPRCAEAQTIDYDLKQDTKGEFTELTKMLEGNGKKKDDAAFDWLILADPPPNDADVVFGKHTIVMQYKAENAVPLSVTAFQQGLWCVPYRIRVLKDKIVHYTGTDALKNFDERAQGVIHETFKKRVDKYR